MYYAPAMADITDNPKTITITTAPATIPTMFQRRACLEQRCASSRSPRNHAVSTWTAQATKIIRTDYSETSKGHSIKGTNLPTEDNLTVPF